MFLCGKILRPGETLVTFQVSSEMKGLYQPKHPNSNIVKNLADIKIQEESHQERDHWKILTHLES